MARSKIIIDLIRGNKPISESLQELFVITSELENEDFNRWIKNELNGYSNIDELPEYRKNLPYQIIYSGINGGFQVKNQPLPLKVFGEHSKIIDDINFVCSSVLELENTNGYYMSKDLTMFAGDVYKNTGISCLSITMKFGNNLSNMILTNIKTRIIESLLLLEREFGTLDGLYIGNEEEIIAKISETNENINTIIFSDGKEF
ncbi:MAG: hypothetical protein E7C82_07510 [Anaerococcus hydrogenalis]|uniref:AbiTii domain-containing protein n=1 Tax=Anaerococcus hydrogenalis TaxID=33029 RepID=UPI002901EFF5|nr:hypothetical protein [Anaerococcus hydrogenalis]MDU2583526.1 hypothetical protein [Anaerococcus hydrogenalis]